MGNLFISEEEKKIILNQHKIFLIKEQNKETQKTQIKTFDATTMNVSKKYWETIKYLEGDAKNVKNGVKQPILKAYKDTNSVWTIGYGHTGKDTGKHVSEGDTITPQQALIYLTQDTNTAVNCVRRMAKEWKDKKINYKFTQGQFDSLVSIVFNVGCDAMRTSTFIQSFKKGNSKKASDEIRTFRKVGNERRDIEAEMFLT
jgi:lysozyme